MSRSRYTLFAIILLASSAPALAFEFTVPMNMARKVMFQVSLNENCTSRGTMVARIAAGPTHGKIQIRQGMDAPFFKEPNPRVACNAHPVKSTEVWYTPEQNYTGADSVTVTWIGTEGNPFDQTVAIQVK